MLYGSCRTLPPPAWRRKIAGFLYRAGRRGRKLTGRRRQPFPPTLLLSLMLLNAMLRHFLRVGILGGCATLAACQSTPDAKTPPAIVAAEPAATQAAASTADSVGAWYRCYRGTLGNSADSITLHLQAWPGSPENPNATSYYGSYSAADGQPYEVGSPFDGSRPPVDSVILRDRRPGPLVARRPAPLWRLHQVGDQLTGTRGRQRVQLRRVRAAGSVALAVWLRADSIAGLPGTAKSPYAHLSAQTLVPIGGDAAVRTALTAGLLRALRGDTTDGQPIPTFDQLWQQTRSRYTRTYRRDAAALAANPDTDSTDLPLYALRYVNQTQTQVFWNQQQLLSIGIFRYDYAGGAHGMYSTQAFTFDTRTGRRLPYAAIFRPGSDEQLRTLLGQAVRRTLKKGRSVPLKDFLFVDEMPLNHNVFLTSGGAVFIYQPYEIASYAQGEVRLFVPVSLLRAVLQPDLFARNPLSTIGRR